MTIFSFGGKNHYPYAGMDFRRDLDLVLPPDAVWDAIGINDF